MLPFSPLRTWILGLVGWAAIVGGIYCLWEWADGMHPPVIVRRADTEPMRHSPEMQSEAHSAAERTLPRERLILVAQGDRQGGWPYLLGGLALLAFSGGGFLPVSWLLGRAGPVVPPAETGGQQQWIDRPDGSRLLVEVSGPPNAPTLVLTHGWSLDRSAWRYLRRDLDQRFRIVAWDLPGLGQSVGPQNNDYSIEKLARDLEAVVHASGPPPIILVGHSIGGMATQTFCRLFPEHLGSRVVGIVLLYTTYTNPLRTALFAPLWTAIEKPILVPLNWLTIWLAPLAWLSNWQSYLNGSLHITSRIVSFAGRQTRQQLDHAAWLMAKAWPGVVARGNFGMVQFDEQSTLPAVEIPVLVIAGQHDRLTLPAASERIEQLLPQGLPARVSAGHLGYWEQHSEVAALIAEFAARCEQPQKSTGLESAAPPLAHVGKARTA